MNKKRNQELYDQAFAKPHLNDDYSIFDESVLQGFKPTQQRDAGELMSTLHQSTSERRRRYAEYKEVAKDPVIGQAIEMMADDATQFDVDRDRTVWVTCSDTKYQEALNGVLKDYLEPYIDAVASSVISKGEFAFKVNNKSPKKRGEYHDLPFLPFKHIERLHHLLDDEQEHAFYVIPKDCKNIQSLDIEKGTFLPAEEYIHFLHYSFENSEELDVRIGKKTECIYILEGESLLTERVMAIYKILKALESSMIKYRLAKSKVVRFVTVETSRLNDNAKAQAIVNYVHGHIVANERVSKQSYDETTYNTDPVVVTIPIKNGVGEIKIEEFVSDINVRDIADVDYFVNKLFAGLRVPKTFFNYMESLPGTGVSGASLARMDIRYARAVKRSQRVLVTGVESIIAIFNKRNGIEPKEDCKVHILKVTSAEDAERYEEVQQRLSTVQTALEGLVNPETGVVNTAMVDIYTKFFTDVVPMPEMLVFLKSIVDSAPPKANSNITVN